MLTPTLKRAQATSDPSLGPEHARRMVCGTDPKKNLVILASIAIVDCLGGSSWGPVNTGSRRAGRVSP